MAKETTGFGIRVEIDPDEVGLNTVTLLETEVTPQGYEGDEKIEQTTNANVKFRSFEPGDLAEKTDISGTCAFDTAALADLKAARGAKATITITFKTGATVADKGWLRTFTPTGMSRGNMPLANFTVELEGEDAAGTDNEVVTQP